MFREMNNNEFSTCHTIEHVDIYKIEKELESKGITDINDKIEYVKKNCYGQFYMYFALKELNDVILKNYHTVNDEFVFAKDAIDGILRSFTFALQYVQRGLPQHAYDYMESKSSYFTTQLIEQYKNKGVI